jgi:hypothetical protein
LGKAKEISSGVVKIKRMLGINGTSPYPFEVGIICLFILTFFLIYSMNCEAQMDKKSVASIGSAKMEEDGTIVLQLRAEAPDGAVGDAILRYPPGHPQYDEILRHLGGLEKGQEKPVAPWPDNK